MSTDFKVLLSVNGVPVSLEGHTHGHIPSNTEFNYIDLGGDSAVDVDTGIGFESSAALGWDAYIRRNAGENSAFEMAQSGTGEFLIESIGSPIRLSTADEIIADAPLRATGIVNAQADLQHRGVAGGIFVPVAARYLTDVDSSTWNHTAGRNVGTYNFDPQEASNGSVPALATAIAVAAGSKWAGPESDSKQMLCYGKGLDYQSAALEIRSQGAGMTIDGFAIVPVGTDGDITVEILGSNADSVYLRIIGYFI